MNYDKNMDKVRSIVNFEADKLDKQIDVIRGLVSHCGTPNEVRIVNAISGVIEHYKDVFLELKIRLET